jgi:hypothetical protein
MHDLVSWLVVLGMITAGGGCRRSCETDCSAPAHDMAQDGLVGPDGGVGDAGGDAFRPASSGLFPTIPKGAGNPVAQPRLVVMYYTGYGLASGITALADFFAGPDWLPAVGREYGVMGATHLSDVMLAAPAPAMVNDSDSRNVITQAIQQATVPAPAADLLYVLYYPQTTTVGDFTGHDACASGTVGGYHWEGSYGGTPFSYIVIPTCSSDPNMALSYVELSSGHELIEAATDPRPLTAPAYVMSYGVWAALDGEVADMCELVAPVQVDGHTLPRVWSNVAAVNAYDDPCVLPQTPFFNVVSTPSTGATVAPGSSFTFSVLGWSSAPVARWTVATFNFGDFDPQPVLNGTDLNNGEVLTLKVTVPSTAVSGSLATVFLLSSANQATVGYWPVLITAQ